MPGATDATSAADTAHSLRTIQPAVLRVGDPEIEARIDRKLAEMDQRLAQWRDQEIINRIVGRIKTLPQAKVEIVGHTDNIGDKEANGKLSLRRAETVRKYLLSKDANLKLESGGKGEAVPVVQCSDKLPKEKLVACLAPNRRVTIDPIY